MLYLVGLGLSDETDITVKGLEVVKKASRVYLEAYTSILLVDQAVLVGIANLAEFFKELTLTSSRRGTMEGQLWSPIVKWLSPTVTRSCAMPRTKMWLSLSSEIPLGKSYQNR